MFDETRRADLQRAAELFLRLRDEADPHSSPLLRGEPAEIQERVLLMLEGLKEGPHGAMPATGAPAGGLPVRHPLRGHPWLVAAAVLAIVALGVLAVMASRLWTGSPAPDDVPSALPPAPATRALADSSWLRVIEARERGEEPDAKDEAEVRGLLGDAAWDELALLSKSSESPRETLRSGDGDALISPRNVITEAAPTFQFQGLSDDPGEYDYRVSVVRLEDLEKVAELRVDGNTADATGLLAAALPAETPLPAGESEPIQYMWTVEPISSSGSPAAGHDDLSAVFSVASPSLAAGLVKGLKPSGQVGLDRLRSALVFEKHNMVDLALAELNQIPADAAPAELALRGRLRTRLRAAAHLPPLPEDLAGPVSTPSFFYSGEGGAETPDPKQVLKQLKETAEKELDTAKKLFSAQADLDASEESLKDIRLETRKHLDASMIALERIAEEFPDDADWAEKLLEDASGLSFWVSRFSTIEDFDYEAELAKVQNPGARAEPAPAAAAARNDSVEVAMEKAQTAESGGDTVAAFYEYLDVVQHHAAADSQAVQRARERLMEIRGQLTNAQLLSYLKRELKSSEVAHRIFAAQEMGALRSGFAAQPLVSALKSEDDVRVRKAILDAFRGTHKRASGKELAYLSKSKDVSLRLAVLDTLQSAVGGRYGAQAAVEFSEDESDQVVDRSLQVMKGIGGRAGAEGLGKVLGRREASQEQISTIFAMLVELNNATAAEVLIQHCTAKGKNRLQAEDCLVQLGEVALVPCINALPARAVAKQVHDVLKRISGQTFGQSQEKWIAWYKSAAAKGGFQLPRYARGEEPWMGEK